VRRLVVALALLCLGGCGAGHRDAPARSALEIDLARTRPAGLGSAFRPPPVGNPAVAIGEPVGALRCGKTPARAYGAHLELFARDRGVVVPAGIGTAPPQRREGAFVRGGRCVYPLRTVDPTGVVLVASRTLPTVGQLFRLWGQPLSRERLGSFAGSPVIAFVDGRRWHGDPRKIPLRRHAQIELEVAPVVEPHPSYTFPPGL
jgi:hypothetical protein